jgi:hypothetical protein
VPETTAPASSKTIKLPIFGNVKKGTAAAVGLGSVGLVLAVWWWRQRQAAQSAASNQSNQASTSAATTTGQMATDPAGNVCLQSQIDPSTGYCSGSAQDMEAQQSLLGEDYGDESALSGTTLGTSPVATTTTFSNNAAWAQAAETYMGSDGADAIAAAISKYIAGQQMSTAQQQIVQEAIAAEGYPPVAGANGYPPAMNVVGSPSGTTTPGTCPTGYIFSTQPTGVTGEIAATGGSGYCDPVTSTGTGGGNPGGTVTGKTVPNLVGMGFDAAKRTGAAAGFTVEKGSGKWKDPVKSQTPVAGKVVTRKTIIVHGS